MRLIKSNKVLWLTVFVVVVLLVALGVMNLRDQHPNATASQVPTHAVEDVSADPERDRNSTLKFEHLARQGKTAQEEDNTLLRQMNRDFYDSDNASQALTVIEQLSAANYAEQAELLKSKINDMCPPAGIKLPAIVPEQEWVIDWITSYCGTYKSSVDDIADGLAWEQHEIETRANRMLEKLTDRTLQQQTESILSQIANAQSWLDLEAIKRVIFTSYGSARASNQWSDVVVHNLGQDIQYQGQQARDIQATALTLLQCIDYVDCGARSPFTISQCYTQPFCEPGWSLYDFLYNTHSPLESDQIFQILEMLLELRSGNQKQGQGSF